MGKRNFLPGFVMVGFGYYICAEAGLALACFDNGVPVLWPAGALLAAALAVRPAGRWGAHLVACTLAALTAHGLWGEGWLGGAPLVLADIGEAMLAAAMIQRFLGRADQVGSSRWLLGLLFGVSVVAPLAGALVAMAGSLLVLTVLGSNVPGLASYALGWHHWYFSHALGMIIFLPCFTTLAHSQRKRQMFLGGGRWAQALGFPMAMALVATVAFGQSAQPLMMMPVLLLVAGIVYVELITLTLMYVMLAVVGLWFIRLGRSPLVLLHVGISQQLQYFQLYLAGTALGIMPVASAVQQMRRLLVRLRESEARYRLLADNSTDIILSTAPDGTITFASASMLQLGQHQPRLLAGRRAISLVARRHRRIVANAHRRAIMAPGETVQVEFLGLPARSAPRWCEAHLRAVINHLGEVECVVSVIRDMAERKEYETALALAAMTDELTGLPNRRQFLDALDESIRKGESGCVALLDLDHFKRINDRYGHAAGDEVLKTFARVAREGLRGSDTLARIGGEEFALLLPGATMDVGQRICARLGQQLAQAITRHEGVAITITTSIGLARLGRNADEAMAAADQALYAAKAAGRDQLAIAA